MRRSASEVIRNLEMRVARLEKQSIDYRNESMKKHYTLVRTQMKKMESIVLSQSSELDDLNHLAEEGIKFLSARVNPKMKIDFINEYKTLGGGEGYATAGYIEVEIQYKDLYDKNKIKKTNTK